MELELQGEMPLSNSTKMQKFQRFLLIELHKQLPFDIFDYFILVIDLLSQSELLSFYKPEGTFYIFPSYDLKIDSVQFSTGLLESKHVIVTPGSAFGEKGRFHFRISYATSTDTISEGIPKINEYVKSLKSKT